MEWQDFKNRLKKINVSLKDFSKIVGYKYNSLTKWNLTQVPICAITIVELLEKMEIGERASFIAIKIQE